MSPFEALLKAAADALNGNEYGREGSKALWDEMKATGLVAVFGASDDLMELRGAVDDELYGAGYFTPDGLLHNRCDDDDCPYFAAAKAGAMLVEPLFCAEPNISWTYKTEIPHRTFLIVEDGEPYCRGIVFSLSDAARA